MSGSRSPTVPRILVRLAIGGPPFDSRRVELKGTTSSDKAPIIPQMLLGSVQCPVQAGCRASCQPIRFEELAPGFMQWKQPELQGDRIAYGQLAVTIMMLPWCFLARISSEYERAVADLSVSSIKPTSWLPIDGLTTTRQIYIK